MGRRHSRRRTLPSAIAATVESADARAQALVVSVGNDGLGLLARSAFAPETLLAITLERDLPDIRLSARVVHCTPQAVGEWYLGCAFVDPELVTRQLGRGMSVAGGERSP